MAWCCFARMPPFPPGPAPPSPTHTLTRPPCCTTIHPRPYYHQHQLDQSLLAALKSEIPAKAEIKGNLDTYKYYDNVRVCAVCVICVTCCCLGVSVKEQDRLQPVAPRCLSNQASSFNPLAAEQHGEQCKLRHPNNKNF